MNHEVSCIQARKTRIAFVTYMLIKMGGAERNLYDLATNLSRNGYEPYIVTFIAGEVARDLAKKGIPVLELPVRQLLSLDTLRRGYSLFRLLRDRQIDILVTYHVDADIFGGLFGKLAGVPIVISNRRDMGFNHRRVHAGFYRIFGRFITAFVAVSCAVRDVVVNRDGVDPKKVHVVHNGVNRELMLSGSSRDQPTHAVDISKDRTIIGVLGRLEYIKGQKTLVTLAHNLKAKFSNFSFLCVGFNDTDYYREMVQMIKGLGVSDHFEFVGHQDDISRFVRKMDFLIFPSKSEGFSNGVIEAMAMGKPVIATRVGGNPEAIVDGETGFLVSVDQPEELQKAAERLCRDTQLRHDMGIRARARTEQMFTLETMVNAYKDIFRRYLNGCRRW